MFGFLDTLECHPAQTRKSSCAAALYVPFLHLRWTLSCPLPPPMASLLLRHRLPEARWKCFTSKLLDSDIPVSGSTAWDPPHLLAPTGSALDHTLPHSPEVLNEQTVGITWKRPLAKPLLLSSPPGALQKVGAVTERPGHLHLDSAPQGTLIRGTAPLRGSPQGWKPSTCSDFPQPLPSPLGEPVSKLILSIGGLSSPHCVCVCLG